VAFKKEVLQLIAANPALRKYRLTDEQWTVAEHLAGVLVVGPIPFHGPKDVECVCVSQSCDFIM